VSFGNGLTTGTTTTTTTGGQSTTITDPKNQSFSGVSGSSTSSSSVLSTLVGGTGVNGNNNPGLSLNTAKGFSPATAFLNADGVAAVISFLNTDSDTKDISLPRSVAQDGVQTELAVIRNIPVFEQNQSAGGAGQNNLTTMKPNYELKSGDTIINEVGVKLKVLPRIVGVTNVFMTLQPEISAQEAIPATYELDGQINTAPIFSRRKVLTSATVPSGFTLVMGGLNKFDSSDVYTKIPVLGDIPGLGYLFRHEDKTTTKQNLLIFVTPTIIADSDFQATGTDFLKSRFVPEPDTEPSAWDSGKPKDWTKPKTGVDPVQASDN
jgi:general secretion pathway protein D